MTHWAKKLGIAAAFALALGASAPSTADASPSFCRSGAGHPRFGRQWCIEKGFGLGGSSYRYGKPSWSYSPYNHSSHRYSNDWRYDRHPSSSYRYGYPYRGGITSRNGSSYRSGFEDGYRAGASRGSYHRHDRDCRH